MARAPSRRRRQEFSRPRRTMVVRGVIVAAMPSFAQAMVNGLILLGSAFVMPVGCSSVPIPPTYTPEELKAQCERQGSGVWHQDDLMGGFCEPQHS